MRTCSNVSERTAPTDDHVERHKSAWRHRRRLRLPCTAELGLWYRHRTLGCECGCVRALCVCVCADTGTAKPALCQGAYARSPVPSPPSAPMDTMFPSKTLHFAIFPQVAYGRRTGRGGTRCKWAVRWAPSAPHLMYEHPSSPQNDTDWEITAGSTESNLGGKKTLPFPTYKSMEKIPNKTKPSLYQPPCPCRLRSQFLPLRTAGETKSC